jgi:WD40 repeat protein
MTEKASVRLDRPFAEAVFSRDGRQVALNETASPSGGIVEVWAAEPLLRGESPGPVFRATGLGGTLMNVCEFSPDGRRLLTSSGGTFKLWDTSTGNEMLTLKASGDTPVQPHFSADGRKIWAGLDEENRFWGWDATPISEAKTP